MREPEVKMLVPVSFDVSDLDSAVAGATLGETEESLIEDTYFDTPDLRLTRWGCTMRHRSGERWTVTVPGPSKNVALDRVQVGFRGGPGVPPARAVALVSSLTRGVAVEEVAQVRTVRQIRRWLADDSTVVAELADDDVRRTTPDGEDVTFREIEVEPAPDVDGQLLDEVVERLRTAARATQLPAPTLAHVLGPIATEPPDVDVTPLPGKPTARQVIQTAFASSAARLLLQLPAARLGTDPEGVHQARVASRRMRSDLKTFEPLLDPEWSRGLATELGWLIDELGAVRDTDIFGAKLRDVIARHPEIDPDAASRVLHQVQLKRRRDRRRLLRHLGDQRAMLLFDHLVAAAADPPTVPLADRRARDVMPKLVRKRWKRLDRAIGRLDRHPAPAELHAVRILAKRVRYATEAVAPAAGKQARKFAEDAATIQDALGELNDATMIRAWLTEVAERLDGPAGFAAGQMTQQLIIETRTHDKRWRAAHRSMAKRTDWFS